MALGSLVVEVAANVARFQSDMGKIAQIAEQRAQQVDKALGVVASGLKSLGAGFVIGLTLDKIKDKIEGAISSAAGLQNLAERTGATVEGLSGLAAVAKLTGVDADQLAGGLQKLSKAMVDAKDGGTKTTAAFDAIGISTKQLVGLKPDEAFLLISNRLATYADGAEKTAIAQALLGKAGANLLPVMKDLAEVGTLQTKVTAEQAEVADLYEKNLVRLNAAQNAIFKTIALELVPVLNAFTEALLASATQADGLRGTVNGLAKDGSIREWGEDAIRVIGFVIDGFQGVSRVVQGVGVFLGGTLAAMDTVWNSSLKEVGPRLAALRKEVAADLDAIAQKSLFSDSLIKKLEASRKPIEQAARPQIDYKPNTGGGAGADAGQKFIEQLQRQVEQQTKGKFEMLLLEAAQKGVSAQAAKYIYQLEAIDIRNEKIKRTVEETAKAEEQRAKVTGFVTTGNDQAKGIINQTEAMGLNAKQLVRLTELRKIDEAAQRASVNATSETRQELDALAQTMRDNVIAALDAADKKQAELNASWRVGASAALTKYADEAANVAGQVENALTNAFKSAEDALVNFVKTGKLDFKSLADSIISDLIRIEAKKLINGLATGASTGGWGGIFSSLFGGGSSGSSWTDGSFSAASTYANGLPYVPYDGMPAILHEGERVMTKQENAGTADGKAVHFDFSGQTLNVGQGVSRGDVAAAVQQGNAQTEIRIRRLLRNGNIGS